MSGWTLPHALDASANAFRDKFGHLSAEEWCDILVASMTSPIIDEVEFPRFAPLAIQEGTHGSSGEPALREAGAFYKFIASREFFRDKAIPAANFLDFGTGWGRIARFFLRDFDLNRFFGFEPRRTSCFLARSLNPYLCAFTGDEIPDQTLPPDRFDLVVGWSVFSHLSEHSTIAWLDELARVVRRDGYCVLSTFGDRFLGQLLACQADLQQGKEVHWYHKYCLESVGDIVEQHERYLRGEFVWIPDDPAKPYGVATFLHEQALLHMIKVRRIPFDVIEFDRESLNMDIFILRRR